MKIEKIETFILKSPLAEPFAFSQGWVNNRAATLVRVTTDDGIEGWGEAFVQGLEPPEIAAAVIDHALKPDLLGRNPLDSSVIWHDMYAKTRDYGRKGSVISALSAIDIALWDIAGKHYQQPVYQLLGGAVRKKVQPYATGFYRLEGQGEAERLAEEAQHHHSAGFTAMKIKLGFGVEDDTKVMQAVASAVDDTEVMLMVDTNHAYGRADALKLGRVLDWYNIHWYEEPLAPEDLQGYAQLRQQLNVPIAAGENEHTAYGFNALFAAEAVDIAQPDIASCGGFTAARDITALAQARGIAVNPHVWGSAVAQAASLQFLAALPTPHHSLFAAQPLLEYDRSSHPFRQQLISSPWSIKDGYIHIPDGPGLGIDVQMDTVTAYSK